MNGSPPWQISPLDPYIRKYAGAYANDPVFVGLVAAVTRAEGGWGPAYTPGDASQTDPRAIGGYCSFGPFQMNRCGGAGAGYSRAQLENPDFAASIMVPQFVRSYSAHAGQQLSFPELAARVGVSVERPEDSSGTAYYNAARGLSGLINGIRAGTGLSTLPPENNIAPPPVDPTAPPTTPEPSGGAPSAGGPNVGGALAGGVASALGGLAQNTVGQQGFVYKYLPEILIGGLGIVLILIPLLGFVVSTVIKVKAPSLSVALPQRTVKPLGQ